MKKFLFVIASLATISAITTSCGTTSNIGNTIKTIQAIKKINDVAGTASSLSSVLSNTLGMNGSQKSSLTGALTDYITGTNGISSLASSNMTEYASKLAGLNSNTLGKLKGIMTAAQYAKMLGLAGKSSSTDSLLKNLVGGESLTPDAMSVLSGLLMK